MWVVAFERVLVTGLVFETFETFQKSARQCSPGQACDECAHFHALTLTNNESLCDFLLITMRIGLLILGTKIKVKFSSTFDELE